MPLLCEHLKNSGTAWFFVCFNTLGILAGLLNFILSYQGLGFTLLTVTFLKMANKLGTYVDLDTVNPYIKEMLIIDPQCEVATSEPYRPWVVSVKVASAYALLIRHAIKELLIHLALFNYKKVYFAQMQIWIS